MPYHAVGLPVNRENVLKTMRMFSRSLLSGVCGGSLDFFHVFRYGDLLRATFPAFAADLAMVSPLALFQ